MSTKFAALNPTTGLYETADSLEELKPLLAEQAWQMYLFYTQNAPYSVITVNEDGSESWAAPNGEPVLSPAEQEALIARRIQGSIGVTTL